MLVQGSAPAYQPRRVRHQLACHLRADGEKRRAAGPEQPLVASEHRPPGYRPRPSSGPHRPAPRTGTGPMPRAGRSRPGRPCPLASRPGPAAVPAGSAAAATRAWRCSERPPRTRTRCGPRRGDPHSPGRLLNIRKRDYSHPRARRNASTPASSRHLRLLMLGRTPRRRVRGPRRRPGARPSATLTRVVRPAAVLRPALRGPPRLGGGAAGRRARRAEPGLTPDFSSSHEAWDSRAASGISAVRSRPARCGA